MVDNYGRRANDLRASSITYFEDEEDDDEEEEGEKKEYDYYALTMQ